MPTVVRPCILVAEDSLVSQRLALAMLEHLGVDAEAVDDGAQAVQASAARPYGAILMDCQLPVLDGYHATREIRRREGSSPRTPIIALTSAATTTERQRCVAAGMDDHLAKPFSVQALSDVLARWISRPSTSGTRGPARSALAVPIASADAGAATLDPEVVDRWTRLGQASGQDLAREMARLFLTDADAQIVALRLAVARGHAAAVVASSHRLRGSSANVGATQLARLCARLEAGSAEGEMRDAATLLDAIAAELERVRLALRSPVPTP